MRPHTFGNPKFIPSTSDLINLENSELDAYAIDSDTSKPFVLRRQGTTFFNKMTRCLLSKCPDKQLEFRSIAPAYRNTFSVQAVYGLEGLEGVARALGGSLTFACFPGYSFLDAEAQHCGRVCTQPEDEADMRALPWEISQNAPKSCETVVVLCTPASCPPAFGSFLGSYDFVDLWNPQRLRYFGSDIVFDPTQSANVENAMHDIYDQRMTMRNTQRPQVVLGVGWVRIH